MKKQFEFYFFISLLIVLSIAFFRLMILFWVPILLAIILAHYFQKPYHLLSGRLRISKSLASLIITFVVLLLVVVPAITLSMLISLQVTQIYSTFSGKWSALYDTDWSLFLERYVTIDPRLKDFINQFDFQAKLINMINTAFEWLFQLLKKTFFNLSTLTFSFLIMLYLLYYFVMEGKYFIRKIKYLIPLPEKDKDIFINHCVQTIDATLIGTVCISISEGIFGGILLWLLGFPSPIFLGIIITILSLYCLFSEPIQFFIPVGHLSFRLQETVVSGLILLLIGFPVIVISQNVIKPKLVGKRSGVLPWLGGNHHPWRD